MARVIGIILLFVASCVPIEMVTVRRIDGQPCRTTKVRPDFYSAEVWTDCLDKDGRAVTIATNHTDLSLLGGLMAVIIPASVAAAR